MVNKTREHSTTQISQKMQLGEDEAKTRTNGHTRQTYHGRRTSKEHPMVLEISEHSNEVKKKK